MLALVSRHTQLFDLQAGHLEHLGHALKLFTILLAVSANLPKKGVWVKVIRNLQIQSGWREDWSSAPHAQLGGLVLVVALCLAIGTGRKVDK